LTATRRAFSHLSTYAHPHPHAPVYFDLPLPGPNRPHLSPGYQDVHSLPIAIMASLDTVVEAANRLAYNPVIEACISLDRRLTAIIAPSQGDAPPGSAAPRDAT
jgi:hypothetical protein